MYIMSVRTHVALYPPLCVHPLSLPSTLTTPHTAPPHSCCQLEIATFIQLTLIKNQDW